MPCRSSHHPVLAAPLRPEFKRASSHWMHDWQPCRKPRRHAVHGSGMSTPMKPAIVATAAGKAMAMACWELIVLSADNITVIIPRIPPEELDSLAYLACRQDCASRVRCHQDAAFIAKSVPHRELDSRPGVLLSSVSA